MFKEKFKPRFFDTDALGHINNASISTWFEEGRRPIFKIFVPDLDPKKWCLIIARIEIDYKGQGYYQKEAEVQSTIDHIGNSSFVIKQEVFQEGDLIASGKAHMVHFDYKTQKSKPLTDEIKAELKKHSS